MFYSIPIDRTQITTTTPIGAKCITHVFFESKNDNLFLYKEKQDTVTITIDGKMICRDVLVLPFCTSTPYGVNRIDWREVALEVGLNVDMSEIKISAGNANDFSVVFVCSDKPNDDFKGFDFVEYHRFALRTAGDKGSNSYYIKQFGEETTIALDHSPLQMFFYHRRSSTNSRKDPKILGEADIMLNFSLSGGLEEEFPSRCDIDLLCAKDNSAWRKVVHTFGQPMPKTLQMTIDYNHTHVQPERFTQGNAPRFFSDSNQPYYGYARYDKMTGKEGAACIYGERNIINDAYGKHPNTWDLYAIFLYKKLI